MSEEETKQEVEEPEVKPLEWQYKKNFAIHSRMRELLEMAKKATEAELKVLKAKLDKATYGG